MIAEAADLVDSLMKIKLAVNVVKNLASTDAIASSQYSFAIKSVAVMRSTVDERTKKG